MSKGNKMQIALVTLALSSNGDVPTSTVEKRITPAELLVLKSIHGVDCIRNIRLQSQKELTEKEKDFTVQSEYHRLVHSYSLDKLKVLWPTLNETMIPFKETFEEIGVSKEVIKRSNLGVGAIPIVVDEITVEECLENKLITKDVIIEAMKMLPNEDVDEIKGSGADEEAEEKLKELDAKILEMSSLLEKAEDDLKTSKAEVKKLEKEKKALSDAAKTPKKSPIGDGIGDL